MAESIRIRGMFLPLPLTDNMDIIPSNLQEPPSFVSAWRGPLSTTKWHIDEMSMAFLGGLQVDKFYH